MRELVAQYLSKNISRRGFVRKLMKTGLTLAAAEPIAESLETLVRAEGSTLSPDSVRIFEGTGGAALAEQLIASGVRYVFGNSASQDAEFYEALVDRPQLTYILGPHEGPGAAMAVGYVKASGKPAITMQAGVVGLCNAMGQMYNTFKEQIPLVFYSYKSDQTGRAGRDGHEEVPNQEHITTPLTKWSWLARRADMIPETVRRAFKVAWTPPYGPTYMTWHSDFINQRVRSEIIVHDRVDPRMRVRPNPTEVERAARLLIEAQMPVMMVGDEVYKTKAEDKAVKLAELLGMPVTQGSPRTAFTNYPQTHHHWMGQLPVARLSSLSFPEKPDVVINVGDKLMHEGSALIVPRNVKFIDLRIDHGSMGNVLSTDVPLVADVAYGLDDLMAAIEGMLTPALRQKIAERARRVQSFSEKARAARLLVRKNPDWDSSPIQHDRLSWEVGLFADPDAIIINEAGLSFDRGYEAFGARQVFGQMGAHLGSGVGISAGAKLARPQQQVICLVGDGSFLFGPTALWNMARLQLPVIIVVYNNHAYAGPHNRVVSAVPGGRMVETRRFFCDYLGKPDINIANIARGFGVDSEVVSNPVELQAALKRARHAEKEGKPYLVDAQVARTGVGWSDDPWVPTISADERKTKA